MRASSAAPNQSLRRGCAFASACTSYTAPGFTGYRYEVRRLSLSFLFFCQIPSNRHSAPFVQSRFGSPATIRTSNLKRSLPFISSLQSVTILGCHVQFKLPTERLSNQILRGCRPPMQTVLRRGRSPNRRLYPVPLANLKKAQKHDIHSRGTNGRRCC